MTERWPCVVEHPAEVEDRAGHRRDPAAVDEVDDVVVGHPVAVVHDGTAVVDPRAECGTVTSTRSFGARRIPQ